MDRVGDGFRFGLGLWLATMLVGTVWVVVASFIAVAIIGG